MIVFDTAAATTLLNTAFASWVRDLDLTIESVDGDTAVLRMAFSD
ncbi:MAG: Thioesterase, partial [Tardiphaga sp.]|nr:Thioesterase [Tardiphaga sp.]